MKALILVGLISICMLNAFGQNPKAIQLEKMNPLQSLVGNWTGDGWIILQDGKKHHFDQTEVITSKLAGAILIIEGNGVEKESRKPIHDAVALLTYDVAKQQYRFTAMTGMGYISDSTPQVKDNGGFVWTLAYPGTTIKYSTDLIDDNWIEVGEMSRDKGVTWTTIFEMKLKRKK